MEANVVIGTCTDTTAGLHLYSSCTYIYVCVYS